MQGLKMRFSSEEMVVDTALRFAMVLFDGKNKLAII
jgi:hypothetical protein